MNPPPNNRPQSAAEEAANSASHAAGFVLAAASLPLLVQASVGRGSQPLHTLAVAVFATTMMLLYLSSALFHGLPDGRSKQFFEKLDRASIYLFIAGSFSPFAASAMNDTRAQSMFVLVWMLALGGVLVTLYTVGAALFLLSRKVRFAYFACHLCVMSGSGLDVAAVLAPP